jgi:hypothetical protein
MFLYSSLLIVYEGYEWDVDDFPASQHCGTSPSTLNNCFCHQDLNSLTEEVDDFSISDEGTRECSRGSLCFPYYDGDASNSSDFPALSSSQEEVNQASHQRGFGEAAARGAKAASRFYPISEETVFMDPPSSSRATGPVESWMLYSSDCSFLQLTESSEEASSDFYNTTVKRIRQHSQCDEDGEEEDDEEEEQSEFLSSSKRVKKSTVDLRAKNNAALHTAGKHRMRQDLPRSSGSTQVDIRMIDFANVTFSNRASGSSASNVTVHHGPDCGFLTGLDSLKRLLTEILSEG